MDRLPVRAARILSQKSHLVPGALKITEYFFEVPTNYAQAESKPLRLFARSAHKHAAPVDSFSKNNDKVQTPWLLYLQGGPGSECRTPQSYPFTKSFTEKGYGVLFLDQRGTGLSTPITTATLKQHGSDEEQASYLSSFRADNIVRDAEAIRLALTQDWPEERRKWTLLGQSFGGFCAVTYLSLFPPSLRDVFITGGLPPVREQNPDAVYSRLVKKVKRRNEDYYDKYPEDVERVKQIVRHLQDAESSDARGFRPSDGLRLPDGGVLTARRFLQMGIGLGFHGAIDSIHDTVIRANSDIDNFGLITRSTASTMAASGGGYDTNLLYCVLHEPIYCQGQASNWSAQRIVDEIPEFNIEQGLADASKPLYFTGENVFSWMLEDYSELRDLKVTANVLATKSDWPPLYDCDALQCNQVPVFAAVYTEDMYVDCDLALDTARLIRNCKYYLTNRIYHDGLRSKMDNVVETLWKLRTDVID